MGIKEILDWLYLHIGLNGTILFSFFVIVVSITIFSIIRHFKNKSSKKEDWGEIAGELKKEVHRIDKEYHDFKNSLSWKQRKSPENQKRLTSLRDRLSYAKKKRKAHLSKNKSKNKNKKSNFLFLLIAFILISLFLFYIYKYRILLIF